MAQRALWRGAISFGLVHVPVEMFSATREHSLKMHFLDSRDFSPVGYERINKSTGKAVDWGHIVKGFEYAKDQYVALSDADFKHANVRASETIDIASFTESAGLSPLYYDTPYYLLPGKGGEKVYRLLREVLAAERKAAVATFVMRGRGHLCAVVAGEDVLTLRFPAEILAAPQSAARGAPRAGIKESELAMARKLVEEMTAPWKPERFRDTYREDLMRRIKEKIRRKQTHVLTTEEPPEPRPKAEVIDLMDALRSSLKLRAKHGARAAPAKRASKRA
jgi:DNA end-binding protein Ku